MELGCRQPCGLPRVADRQAASVGGQGVSGTGNASWVLGLGRPSGFLLQDVGFGLRGAGGLLLFSGWAGLALPVFAFLVPAFDQVACD
eukprot:352131-Chlamydomonas_euryale.AAC.3